jgi:hypothetical protein
VSVFAAEALLFVLAAVLARRIAMPAAVTTATGHRREPASALALTPVEDRHERVAHL